MTLATLITLDFKEPSDSNKALQCLIDDIRQDVNCRSLIRGSALHDQKKVLLLAGWTTEFYTPSLEHLLPDLASLPSARHLNVSTTLNSLFASDSTISCDIHILRLPLPSSTSLSSRSSNTAGLRAHVESLNLNPYIAGNASNRRSVAMHMPCKAGTQVFKACYRAWSQSANPTPEQEAAADADEKHCLNDEEYVLIVQWRDRQSGEEFKNPNVETESLKPDLWETSFISELMALEGHGVTRSELRVDWENVTIPDHRQSRIAAPHQLSRSQSRSRSQSQSSTLSSLSRSQSQSSTSSSLSRSQSLRQRDRSQSSCRDLPRSIGERSESFDARERSRSLGKRRESFGEVRDEEVGAAVEQRLSLRLSEMSKFQFEYHSDSDDDSPAEDPVPAGKDTVDGSVNASVAALDETREEEEDESGELREGISNPRSPLAPESQVASTRHLLEEGPRSDEHKEEDIPPWQAGGLNQASNALNANIENSQEKPQRQKRYSSLLKKDEEEKQELPTGPGLMRTKTLPAQARVSLKLELTKSRLERMGSVH